MCGLGGLRSLFVCDLPNCDDAGPWAGARKCRHPTCVTPPNVPADLTVLVRTMPFGGEAPSNGDLFMPVRECVHPQPQSGCSLSADRALRPFFAAPAAKLVC